jgi:hypothetical protein
MNRITLAATAAAVLAMAVPAAAQTSVSERPPAVITVSGQADVDHAPDQATVSFSIVTNDDNATRATSANNSAYNALVAKLGGAGVAASQIRTESYDVAFNPHPAQPNPQFAQRYGYIVTRNVSATTPNTAGVGAVIDAGISAGVTNVGAVSFGIKNNRGAYNQALAAAVADADQQAHALADAAHVRIVRILSIGAGSSQPGPRPLPQFARVALAAPVPTEIQPGALTVHASVTVRYEIAP